MIALFDRLKEGAESLTGPIYLVMNEDAPIESVPERHRVEELLERFDWPLNLRIVEYSRAVDLGDPRSVRHLGEMPDV